MDGIPSTREGTGGGWFKHERDMIRFMNRNTYIMDTIFTIQEDDCKAGHYKVL